MESTVTLTLYIKKDKKEDIQTPIIMQIETELGLDNHYAPFY